MRTQGEVRTEQGRIMKSIIGKRIDAKAMRGGRSEEGPNWQGLCLSGLLVPGGRPGDLRSLGAFIFI